MLIWNWLTLKNFPAGPLVRLRRTRTYDVRATRYLEHPGWNYLILLGFALEHFLRKRPDEWLFTKAFSTKTHKQEIVCGANNCVNNLLNPTYLTRAKLIDPTPHQGRFRGLTERAIRYLKEDTEKKGPSSWPRIVTIWTRTDKGQAGREPFRKNDFCSISRFPVSNQNQFLWKVTAIMDILEISVTRR